jgi:serine/threonine-protein kinase
MSPEQALGLDDIDERTDIWSLCVVLYEVVTGKVPFLKPNYNALMHAIINEDPLPTMDSGAGDKSLWQIIERGLKKQREQRYPNVTELGEALALWLYEHGIKEDLSGNSIRAVWLDTAMTGSAHLRSARPAQTEGNDARRNTVSKSPTMRAPETTSAETVLTVAPNRGQRGNRALTAVLPAVALLAGAAGAWLWISAQKPATPAVASAPQTVTLPPQPVQGAAAKPEPTVPPAPVEAAEPATPAPSAKPSPSGAGKVKTRAPLRKKGHDFGF